MKKIVDLIKGNKIIIFIFILAILSVCFWNHRFFFKPLPTSNDAGGYVCLATDLLEKHTYTSCGKESFRAPLYPFFLASVFYIFDYNPDVVRFIQLFLFGLICVLIYFLGAKLFDKKVGIVAGSFSALFWGFANFAGVYLRQMLFVFLTLVLVFLLYRASETLKNKYFIFSGLVMGLLTLTHATAQYLIVLVVLSFILTLRKKISARVIFLKLGILIISFIIIITPWIIRNKLHYAGGGNVVVPRTGEAIMTRVNFMEKLYPDMPKHFFGNLFGYYFAEKLFQEFDMRAFREIDHELRNRLLDQGFDFAETDSLLIKEGVERIIKQPHKYILMSLLDFINYNSPLIPQGIFRGNTYAHYTFTDGAFPQIPEYIKVIVLLAFRLSWHLFLFLVFFGLVKNFKNKDKIIWMFLVILYFNFVHSAVHANPKHALQIYPFYIILATSGFFIIINKLRLKYKKSSK